jgi:hypothetical protein
VLNRFLLSRYWLIFCHEATAPPGVPAPHVTGTRCLLNMTGQMIGATLAQPTSVLRFLFFVPLTPELLTTSFVRPHLPCCSCSRAHMHMVPVFTRINNGAVQQSSV